jgi:hypothetical protein
MHISEARLSEGGNEWIRKLGDCVGYWETSFRREYIEPGRNVGMRSQKLNAYPMSLVESILKASPRKHPVQGFHF